MVCELLLLFMGISCYVNSNLHDLLNSNLIMQSYSQVQLLFLFLGVLFPFFFSLKPFRV